MIVREKMGFRVFEKKRKKSFFSKKKKGKSGKGRGTGKMESTLKRSISI